MNVTRAGTLKGELMFLQARFSLRSFLTLFLVLFCLSSSLAQANVGEAYGFGARTEALAGAGAAWGFDSFASYANPAGLPFSAPEGRKGSVALSALFMDPRFLSINNVYVENDYVSGTDRIGSVDTTYRSTLGQTLGLTYLFSEKRNLTFGIVSFLPINQLAFLDTGEAFHPEYVLYRARTQRPQIEFGMGGNLTPTLHLGAGMHLAFSVTANANVFLNSDQSKPSTMRFSSSIKPKASPYLGLLWTPSEQREQFTLGAVIRLPAISDTTMVLRSGTRLFGTNRIVLDFNFTALSALFYDPLTLELGTSWQHSSHGRLYTQVDFQAWSKFQTPALEIQAPDITSCSDSCGFAISPGKNPPLHFQNILIPRLAEEWRWGEKTFRIGYGYRPSAISGLSTEAGNYLDPPKHMITVGVGLELPRFLGTEIPAKLDFVAAYHQLVTQHVSKTPGNEAGNMTDAKIGAPGYDAGGKILGGGVSLSLSL